MFGIVYLTTMLGALGINKIKTGIENESARQRAKTQNKKTYMDNNLCSRLVSNNAKVMRRTMYTPGPYCEYKDEVLKCVGKDVTIRNFTKEEREKSEKENYKKAIKNGKTTYRLGKESDNHSHDSKFHGYRYKDINTGDIYVIRTINKRKYFMSIKTGKFIGVTDGQKEVDNKYKIFYNDKQVIHRMNREQNQWIKKYGYIYNFDAYCYLGGRDYEDY